jgi:hypothetical protein
MVLRLGVFFIFLFGTALLGDWQTTELDIKAFSRYPHAPEK